MAKYKKGKSGNPGGRPPGIRDKRVQFRDLIADRAEDIVLKVIEKALEGDSTAYRLCMERICPALRPIDGPVAVAGLEGTLSEQGRTILAAMARGEITPSQASELLGALGSQARLVEADELEKRIAALEARIQQTGGRA
jgi:hypothetical protein